MALRASGCVMHMAPTPLNTDHSPGQKAEQIVARLPTTLKAKLARIAAERGTTPSAVLREALESYLASALAEEVEADLAREFGDPGGEP